MKVEHRQPNVERFLEIFTLGSALSDCGLKSFRPMICFYNIDKDYEDELSKILHGPKLKVMLNSTKKIEESEFCVEYSRPYFVLIEKSKYESYTNIIERILSAMELVKTTDVMSRTTLNDSCAALLKNAYEKWEIPVYHANLVIKLSRIIATLEGKKEIGPEHIAEAIQYSTYVNKGSIIGED